VSGGKATLFVTAASSANLCRAARNLPKAEVTTVAQANTYQMTRYPVVFTDAAGLDALAKRLAGVEA
jgi:ribosomal protein L4